jgi:hypothetical protein
VSGTRESALKAVETKRHKYGVKFFAEAGRKGGLARNKSPKKFIPFLDKKFASLQGKKSAKIRWGKKDEL